MTYTPAQVQLAWELQHIHHYSEVHWRMLIQNRILQCLLSTLRLREEEWGKKGRGGKNKTDMNGKLLFNAKILRHNAIKPLMFLKHILITTLYAVSAFSFLFISRHL